MAICVSKPKVPVNLEKELDDCATLSSRQEFINEYNFLVWFYDQVENIEPGMTLDLKAHYPKDTGDHVPEWFLKGGE